MLDPTKPNPLIAIGSLMREPLPKLVWDVKGTIVRGDRILLYGEWGTFKTFLATHLSIHLAGGAPWLGFQVPEPRKVLYIDEEMNPLTAKRRVYRQMLGAHEVEDIDIPLRIMSMEGVRFNEYEARNLLTAFKRWDFKPDFIVLDAMRRIMIGNEKEGSDVARFWNNLKPLAKEGITTLVIHHMNKAPSDPTIQRNIRDRASGSTDILAGADAAWALTRTSQNSAQVTFVKGRDQEEPPPFEFIIHSDRTDEDSPIEIFKNVAPKKRAKGTDIWGASQPLVCGSGEPSGDDD